MKEDMPHPLMVPGHDLRADLVPRKHWDFSEEVELGAFKDKE
jgi:hypothetical protein